jgi:hypothetical protein
MTRLANKTALVTASSRGIGPASRHAWPKRVREWRTMAEMKASYGAFARVSRIGLCAAKHESKETTARSVASLAHGLDFERTCRESPY